LLTQQPFGQLAASHTHWPFWQLWPAPQAAPLPHRHAPFVQLSAVLDEHAVHAPPWEPHAPRPFAWHTPFAQQPFGQLVASHTHCPLEQRWPAAHDGPAPQRQAPPAQLSAPAPHETHAAPLKPHAVAVCIVVHVLPEQHPFGQLAAVQPLQTPLVHVWPIAQPWHAPPPAPQELVELPGWHWFAEQHPLGQLVASHTHEPFEHRWPALHAGPLPQRQLPPEQLSALAPQLVHAAPPAPQLAVLGFWHVLPLQQPFGQLVASHTHAPFAHRWPAAHGIDGPHAQVPCEQLSLRRPHDTQPMPPLPHVCVEGIWQLLPLQQPPGQLVASHTQTPFAQRWPAPHAAFPPQRHWPPEHASAVLPQMVHEAPPVPQVEVPGWRHWLPSQQPFGQLVASQTQLPF